jgi:hypothetical protein
LRLPINPISPNSNYERSFRFIFPCPFLPFRSKPAPGPDPAGLCIVVSRQVQQAESHQILWVFGFSDFLDVEDDRCHAVAQISFVKILS